MTKKKHLNSIDVAHNKYTSECPTEMMPTPDFVYISMAQHIGAPCKPLVNEGDYVKVGQLIGDTNAFVSAPIHASVSGIVSKISQTRSATGAEDVIVVVKADKKQEMWEGINIPNIENREDFIKAIRESGLVGLGGASFPTHIKYNPKNIEDVHTLIVNGAECEPFITSDNRLMLENTNDILDGTLLVMKWLELSKCYIGVESNKPKAIAELKATIAQRGCGDKIEVFELFSRYPKGAERVLVYEITGQKMDAGVLPAALGVILSNITSVAFVGGYFRNGIPLVSKRMTVDGNAVMTPKNIIAPIGTRIADVINYCGGYNGEPKKILMGGPMMGRAVYSDSLPIVKNNNAILAFTGRQAYIKEETACINCGRCRQACPFELLPSELSNAYKEKDVEALEKLNVMQCMECGSCTYVCPARRPLSFTNKLGKALLKEAQTNNGN